ncbi:hypothetical protein [Massilia sp. DD77]|uniref:hypothetical protein n=1 Tax=Massilia sp. DD77 TaxID=3109349 RepID=UPI002FFE7680
MRHNLKAVFDDRGTAQQALDELLASGYARADTDLVTIPGVRSGYGAAPAPGWLERPGTASARLLSRLVGQAHTRPAPDPQPDTVDSHVLTLSTDSAEEAERAASVVSGFMHLCSDEAGTSVSAKRADMAYVAHRRAAGPGTLEFSTRELSHYFGKQATGDMSIIRTTYRDPMLQAGHRPGPAPDDEVSQDRHTGLHGIDAASGADMKLSRETGDAARTGWNASRLAGRHGRDSTNPETDDDSWHRSHWSTSAADGAGEAGLTRGLSTLGDAPVPGYPGTPTAWENFVDALKYGWDRTGIGRALDETDYRLHHAHTYPGTNYGDLAPVYRYGHNVHRRDVFQGRAWDDVEGELRAEWECGHREGKPATWDNMKAAMHHGWDRLKN